MSVIVFLGPSLPRDEARRLVDATFLQPARQGDVFRALAARPRVLVLIDGVFEAVPSVWHHELRAALASGVHVLGAASMGALRAAELHPFGMRAVGRIAAAYVSGERIDDADVALLHGAEDSGFQALTVPLVNAEPTIERARKARVITPLEAGALRRLATATFYKHRTWRQLVSALRPTRQASVLTWLRAHVVDQKAADAREALRLAAVLAATKPARPTAAPLSSFVRRRRLIDTHQTSAPEDPLVDDGTRRLLLASFARLAGLTVDAAAIEHALRDVDDAGLGADERWALGEALALDRLVLAAPERFVNDGPSRVEGAALAARLRRPRRDDLVVRQRHRATGFASKSTSSSST